MKKILGFDIGGTKCAVCIGEYSDACGKPNLRIVIQDSFLTSSIKDPIKIIEQMCTLGRKMAQKTGIDISDIEAIGISCGGPLDVEKRMICAPPNLPEWKNIEIGKIVYELMGIVPTLMQDANACALAEWKFGAGKNCKDIVFITYGTGLGAGLVLDNKIYLGSNGMAGEIGHVRLENWGPVGYGKAGSAEGFCSGGGMAQIAEIVANECIQQGKNSPFVVDGSDSKLDVKELAEAARKGNLFAKRVFEISGNYLGKIISVLIDILNPERIIIGSIYSRCADLLEEEVYSVLSQEALGESRKICKIVPSGLGENVGNYAALSAAIYDLLIE